ncbi:MAG: sugar ABC transporter permease, partial [Proteobacteria bacterium]|nr:sugar ABC transporter permease [Pseudomonadota bacterium]
MLESHTRTGARTPLRLTYKQIKTISHTGALLPAFFVVSVQVALLASALSTATTDNKGNWTMHHVSRVLADPLFARGVVYNVIVPVASVGLEALVGIGMAFWFMTIRRNRMLWRTLAVVPFALPEIVYLLTMKLLFREHGYLNSILVESFGFHGSIGWLEPGSVLMVTTVILIDAWRVTPFVFLLVLAALEQLPESYVEAARVDGANRWHIMRRIQFPLVLPALGIALALRSIDAFRIFAAPLVLAGIEGTPVLSTVAYHYRT